MYFNDVFTGGKYINTVAYSMLWDTA